MKICPQTKHTMEIIQEFGKIAGIAGIGLGVFLFLFKDIIAKNIFPRMTSRQAYNTIRLMMLLVWSIAVVGIGTWAFFEYLKSKKGSEPVQKETPTQNPPTNDSKPPAEPNKPIQDEPEQSPKSSSSVKNKSAKPNSSNDGVHTEIHNSGTIGNVISGKDVKVEIKEQKIETPKEKNN